MSGMFWRDAVMQCAEFERRLNMLLDQRRSAGDDVLLQLHAADCAECQQLLTGQFRLLEIIRCDISSLPEKFTEKTVQLAGQPARRTSRQSRTIAALLAMAATLFIVASPIARRWNNSRL